LLEIIGVNQLLDLVLIITTKYHQLLVREFIDELVSELPQLANNKGDICRKEAEKPAAIVLGHVLHEWLDAILGDLRHTHVLQIEDGGPGLDRPGNHGVLDDILEEEVGQG